MATDDRPPPPAPTSGQLVDPPEPWSGPVHGPAIPGVTYTPLPAHHDARGWFTKVFQRSAVADQGGEREVAEVYLSGSARGVVRGLHFQSPPHDHAKTVGCIEGAAYDVVVDLRAGSPTEGAVAAFRLDARRPARLHLPRGVAHGFQALADQTTMVYVVSTEHAPEHDHGVHFDSVGMRWPINPVVVSERDAALPPFDAFTSPFHHQPGSSHGG